MTRVEHDHQPVDDVVAGGPDTTLTGRLDIIKRPSAAPVGDGGEPRPRRHLVFGVIALALMMASVDATIVATALVAIQTELQAGIEWSGWTITVYALGQILVMPLAGKLSDMYGRKTIFVGAVVVFTAASLACGLSTSIGMLVALRFVQAIGGGAIMPSATGIVSDQFGRDRDRAIGLFASIFPIGGIIGPILGGVIVATASWRWIFFVNVPVGLLLIVLGLVFIPRGRLRPSKRVDLLGILLLGVLILAMMFGFTYLGGGGAVLSLGFLGSEGVAALALVGFLLRAKYAEAPFIPMHLLRGRGFGVMHTINFLFGAAALGFGSLIPLYAHDRFGISLIGGGTLLTARAVGMICVAGLATFALRRTGYRAPMFLGFAIAAVGLFAMAFPPPAVIPYVWLSIAGGVTGIGMGLAVPAANNATMQLAPEHISAISGLRGMFRQSGAIVGVSVATALLAGSADPGETLAGVFVVFAFVIVAVLPLVFLVPEHRGRW